MGERRTKIVATVGPASDDPATLRALVAAGMDMARLSLAHGPVEETLERVRRVRDAATGEGRIVGVLADLPGPKIRAAAFPEEGVHLEEGDHVELVPAGPGARSEAARIAVDDADLTGHVAVGDRVALGDGGIQLEVGAVHGDRARARVVTGGLVRGRPGVSLPGSRWAPATPTPEDLRLLEAIRDAEVDAVAVSFVRAAGDVERVRSAAGPDGPMMVAKIETQEAVDEVDAVIAASDAVMVARGDLGIRAGLEDVPHHQKRIIRAAVAYGRPVITATQMLESMIDAPTPTRAEVSDVANAVFDGTSALMLSGETAIGHHPVGTVQTMARIAARAEREFDHVEWGRDLGRQQLGHGRDAPGPDLITAAVSAAGWRAATDVGAAAIIACTNTGATARAIARFRPPMPIVGATPLERTARQLSVSWGVTPLVVERRGTTDDIVRFATDAVVQIGVLRPGDRAVVLVGSPGEPEAATDMLRVVRIH